MPRARKTTKKSMISSRKIIVEAKKKLEPGISPKTTEEKKKEEEKFPIKIGPIFQSSSPADKVGAGLNQKMQNKNSNKLESRPLRRTEDEARKNMNPPKINLYRKIALSFIVLTVILLAVIFYFSFVKLNIVLIPAQERISDNLIIDVYGAGGQPTVPEKALTGIVEQIAIEEKNTYSASGAETIGEEVTGKVTIINNYNKNQPLVATTRLLSPDNKLFRIKNTINVPAGGSQEVEIYADLASAEMAIGPTKFTIPGLWAGLQDKIYGESKEKFAYGQQAKKYIQQSDIDQAVKDLKRSLLEKAKREIGETYKGYNEVIYNIDENAISTEIGGKVGEEKDKFDVSMKTMVTIVAFSGEEVARMAREKLEEAIPDIEELIEFKPEEIGYSLNNFDAAQSRATINVTFEGKMTLKSEAQIIDRQKIVNLTREQLEDYLSGFKEIAGYEINFFPSFIDKAPNLVDRIKIEIKK